MLPVPLQEEARSAPKKLVVLAVVLKRLVVVALVPVALTKVKFCKVVEPITKRSPEELIVVVAVPPTLRELAVKMPENKLVEVAWVEVLLVMLLKM